MKTLDRILITRANEMMEHPDIKHEREYAGIARPIVTFPHNNPGRCRICNTPIVQARRGRTRIICKSPECQQERQRIHARA